MTSVLSAAIMFRFLLLAAAVAFACATPPDCCSTEDRKEVRSLWERVWSAQYTGRRVKIAQEIFNRMFEMDDSIKGLFSRVGGDDTNSAPFRAHCVRVANGLDNMINLADNPDALEKQMEHYGIKHKGYDGFKSDYFKLFVTASNDVLPQAVPCFNSAAWTRCLELFTNKMTHYMNAE